MALLDRGDTRQRFLVEIAFLIAELFVFECQKVEFGFSLRLQGTDSSCWL
jgi:hypothetical protein